jgi:hypothetical protein
VFLRFGQAGHMTPDIEAFLAELRLQAQAAFDADPQTYERHFEALVLGLRRIYERGADDPAEIEKYDRVRAVVAHRDWPFMRRLQAIMEIVEGDRTGQH